MSAAAFSYLIFPRVVWALLIVAAGVILYLLLNRFILYRAQKNVGSGPAELQINPDGKPAILYFTTPECVACKVVQRPALQQLQDDLGDQLRVIEINAHERPDLASRWGVLSVPTTFVIDPQGQLRHVNHGATRAEKLMQQIEEIVY